MQKWLKITLLVLASSFLLMFFYFSFIDVEGRTSFIDGGSTSVFEYFIRAFCLSIGLTFWPYVFEWATSNADSHILDAVYSIGRVSSYTCIVFFIGYFACSPMHALISIYDCQPILSIIGTCLITVFVCSTLVLLIAIRYTDYFSLIAKFRVITYSLAVILPLYMIVTDFWGIIQFEDSVDSFNLLLSILSSVYFANILFSIPILLGAKLLFQSLVLALGFKKFSLFLRSFGDKDEDEVYDCISRKNHNVVRIGNPRLAFSINDFFLPSNRWKRYLDYYIEKSERVFVLVNDTPGTRWEMFEHARHRHKYLYIVTDKENVLKIINEKSLEKYEKTSLMICLKEIVSNESFPETLSFTDFGDFYFNIFGEGNPDYHIAVPFDSEEKQTESPGNFLRNFLFDSERFVVRNIIGSFKGGIKISHVIFQIIEFILGWLLMVGSVICMFWPKTFEYEQLDLPHIIGITIAFVVGVWIEKDFFSKPKKMKKNGKNN